MNKSQLLSKIKQISNLNMSVESAAMISRMNNTKKRVESKETKIQKTKSLIISTGI
jgi:hypothetical protein